MRCLKQIFLCVCALILSVMLSSCADTELPQWFSGEPTRAELEAYKGPIPMPAIKTDGKEWPNLADVPARPTVLMAPSEKNALINEMKNKNAEANAEIAAFNKKTAPSAKPVVPKKKKKKKVR